MEKLKLNINNKRYYSEDFIKGWKTGVEAQFKADVQEQQPKGKWIDTPEGAFCSKCGLRALVVAKGNYCPNCGAKMEK